MVDSEYSMDIYKSVRRIIGTVMRNPELLKFVPDHLKTKKMFNDAVEKLAFVVNVPDQYKTQQIYDKAI